MKNKIIAISLLTLTLVGVSAMLIMNSINNLNVSENVLPSFGKTVNLDNYDSFEKMVEVPAFKGRVGSARSFSSGTDESPYNYSVSTKNPSEMIANSSPGYAGHGISNFRGSGKKNNSVVNNSPIAMNNSVIVRPIDRAGSFSSGTVAERRESAVAQVSEPFTSSNSMIPGPMRMDGDGESPPGEGAPVGEGLIVLLLFAGAYLFYRRKL